jgi:biopolymer transport protein ExbD
MIDVLLVLLIIFMLIVPMSRKALDVTLPDPTPSTAPVSAKNDQIVLEVSASGTYMINKQPVPPGGLDARLHQVYDGRPDKLLFVKGDTLAAYQTIIQAIDIAHGAGVEIIGIPPKDAAQ